MPLTFNALYLGNVATSMDPTEGNTTAENAGNAAFVRTWGSATQPLSYRWVSITAVDNGGTAGTLDQNNLLSNDQIVVTREHNQKITQTFDASATYAGRITYANGTQSANNLPFTVIQTTDGDLYLVPALSGTTNSALSLRAIRSITFNSMQTNTLSGMTSDRPVISFVPCFARGTLLEAPDGPRAVETLQAGDLLSTLDHGARPVRWVGHRRLSGADLTANPRLAPIRIAAGALGCGLPARDLCLSPQHRVMLAGPTVRRATGHGAVLVAAHRLAGLPGIGRAFPAEGVEYWHILFDAHEVILSEGAATESLWPGPEVLKALDPAALEEVRRIIGSTQDMTPARPFVEGKAAARLVERHARQGKLGLVLPLAGTELSQKDNRIARAA